MTYQTSPYLAFCTPGKNQGLKRFSTINHTTLLMLLGTVYHVVIFYNRGNRPSRGGVTFVNIREWGLSFGSFYGSQHCCALIQISNHHSVCSRAQKLSYRGFSPAFAKSWRPSASQATCATSAAASPPTALPTRAILFMFWKCMLSMSELANAPHMDLEP